MTLTYSKRLMISSDRMSHNHSAQSMCTITLLTSRIVAYCAIAVYSEHTQCMAINTVIIFKPSESIAIAIVAYKIINIDSPARTKSV